MNATPRRSHMIVPALAYAKSAGIDTAPIVAELGLDLDAHGEPAAGVMLPLASHRALLSWLAKAMNDPLAGIAFGSQMRRGSYGLVEYVCRSSNTIGDALLALARYAVLLDDQLFLSAEIEGDSLRFEHALPGEPECLGKQGNEAYLTLCSRVGAEVTGSPVPAERVWLAHADDTGKDELARALVASAVDFGIGTNGFVLSRAVFERPILTADPALRELLVAQAEQRLAMHESAFPGRFLARLNAVIRDQLQSRMPTIESVGKALHVGERTMQREIAKYDTTFQELVESARDELARHLLRQTTKPITSIAEAVHYSAPSAFVRAFHRRTGITPGAFRLGSSAPQR